MVFKGQAEYSVDSKGRVAIPSSMRSVLNPEAKGTFTVTRGLDKCIFLYPLDQWSQIEAEIAELNSFNPEARRFIRRIMRWAREVSLDKQGRITLPKNLINFADLDGTALILGSFDHIEIWDPDHFDEYLNEDPDDYETLAEQVMG